MRRLTPSIFRAGIFFVFVTCLSTAILHAGLPPIDTMQASDDRERYLDELGFDQGPALGLADTVRFGGDGFGNVVRGSEWTWETLDPSVTPAFFPDGDPVGNEYADGWTFEDRTTRRGPSQLGAGHWAPDGTYDFDDDTGSFAHRISFHANDGVDDGPDPITLNGGAWSLWIGTNLYLNPEHCGWDQTAGHGNGWSQGFQKRFPGVAQSSVAMSFFHRYAVEVGFDTNWVEVSTDGIFWEQIGSDALPQGFFNGGDKAGPLPSAAGGQETVIVPHPDPGVDLWIRFRLASDGFFSDESEGGVLFHGWVLDDIAIPALGEDTDFETGYGGWEPAVFEGFDFALTLDPDLAAGRIVNLADLNCTLIVPCPEACALSSNILMFADKDDCDLNDSFQDSYATSPAFSIGGPENPDIDGFAGRLIRVDNYIDGGTGDFYTGLSLCWVYRPFNSNHCGASGYTPPAGAPGEGQTFNWSRTGFPTCDFYGQGTGPRCVEQFVDNVSANLPAEADSVILHIGAYSACRSVALCVTQDNGAPFIDNLSFGVFDPQGLSIRSRTLNRYADSFPVAEYGAVLGIDADVARADGPHDFARSLGIEQPLRTVRADTASVDAAADEVAAFLRWRVRPGPCQDLSNAFFATFPPNAWHAARMDTARSVGTGTSIPGAYMTCFHEDSPLDGTSWSGEATPLEPCDDILPDGVFQAGTHVDYFYELRHATTGAVLGTSPAGRNSSPVDTLEVHASLWYEMRILPELIPPPAGGCNPQVASDRANEILVVHDTESNVHRSRIQAFLDGLGLEYDFFQANATNYNGYYNTIGRREDRAAQAPRPPLNGATGAQLDPYRVIWYSADLLDGAVTLSDETTQSFFGGQPSRDQQAFEDWLDGCQPGENRLLILDGYGWASDVDNNTTNGPVFLTRLGVDVVTTDYADLRGDLRRCARITGTALAPSYGGEVFGTGCPDDTPADIFVTVGSGQAVTNYVQGNGTADCADDQDLPADIHAIRQASAGPSCAKSVAFAAPVIRTHDLKCTDGCLFQDWTLGGATAQLIADLFAWAGKPISAPIAVGDGATPAPAVTKLLGVRPNPSNPSATIRFTLAERGHVQLKIYDVSGRLVRTLVDAILDASHEPYEVDWDGSADGSGRVSSGVFFYALEAPGCRSAKKLVVLE